VLNDDDRCPDTPGTKKNHGCPQNAMAVLVAGRIDIVERVYFRTDKDIIEARSFGLLKSVAKILKEHPEIAKITVEGHTDNQGKADHNMDLSKRRAAAVVKFLVKEGIAEARLESQGYGQTRPVASNDDETGRAANRRVVFVIPDAAGAVQERVNAPDASTATPAKAPEKAPAAAPAKPAPAAAPAKPGGDGAAAKPAPTAPAPAKPTSDGAAAKPAPATAPSKAAPAAPSAPAGKP